MAITKDMYIDDLVRTLNEMRHDIDYLYKQFKNDANNLYNGLYDLTKSVEKNCNRKIIALTNEEILNLPLKLLNISVRAINCLNGAEIKTPKDLIKYSFKDLKKIPNLGIRSIRQICEELEKINLRLKTDF